MPEFASGLKLIELFYTEAAKPILELEVADLKYSAGPVVSGSEVRARLFTIIDHVRVTINGTTEGQSELRNTVWKSFECRKIGKNLGKLSPFNVQGSSKI